MLAQIKLSIHGWPWLYYFAGHGQLFKNQFVDMSARAVLQLSCSMPWSFWVKVRIRFVPTCFGTDSVKTSRVY